MKWVIVTLLLTTGFQTLVAAKIPVNYKEAIAVQESLINQSSLKDRSEQKLKLAKIYYQDQNLEKAFEVFLSALNDSIPLDKPSPEMSTEENLLYTQALKLYLDQSENPQIIAFAIQKKYSSTIKSHPEYDLLGYIIAAAYANQEEFSDYFDRFYQSYQHYPSHYLAYKGKAALHAQLFARRRTIPEREKEQQLIVKNLEEAINKYPSDTSLYKMILVLAPDNQKKVLVNRYLNKIIDENIIISRADIVFYIQQAAAVQELSLAQRFLNKGREWYQNSRSLDAAQQYIKDKG